MLSRIKKLAFIAPRMSRDLSDYYAGVLDCIRNHPEIFVDVFTFGGNDLSRLAGVDGIISYSLPPQEVWDVFDSRGLPRPPTVAITTLTKAPPNVAIAHIDPNGIALRVVELLVKRNCEAFAFCSCHAKYYTDESAELLKAFRRAVTALTGKTAHLFSPKITTDQNVIPSEVARFAEWMSGMPRPCGILVHGDDVAKKMLDSCRMVSIDVPRELKVVGMGDSPLFCPRTQPTLTSYAVNHVEAGFKAVVALHKMLMQGKSATEASFEITLPDITERASTIIRYTGSQIAQKAMRMIQSNIEEGKTPKIKQIAHDLNISRRKLELDFAAEYSRTLHNVISEYRLLRLKTLVETTDQPFCDLVKASAFTSRAQAERGFIKLFGITMTEARERR